MGNANYSALRMIIHFVSLLADLLKFARQAKRAGSLAGGQSLQRGLLQLLSAVWLFSFWGFTGNSYEGTFTFAGLNGEERLQADLILKRGYWIGN